MYRFLAVWCKVTRSYSVTPSHSLSLHTCLHFCPWPRSKKKKNTNVHNFWSTVQDNQSSCWCMTQQYSRCADWSWIAFLDIMHCLIVGQRHMLSFQLNRPDLWQGSLVYLGNAVAKVMPRELPLFASGYSWGDFDVYCGFGDGLACRILNSYAVFEWYGVINISLSNTQCSVLH